MQNECIESGVISHAGVQGLRGGACSDHEAQVGHGVSIPLCGEARAR